MGNKKIGLGLMLNLIGAMFAYLIGSGFASGQDQRTGNDAVFFWLGLCLE